MPTTKKIRVTVDGKPYDVVVEMPTETVAAPALSTPVAPSASPAPMSTVAPSVSTSTSHAASAGSIVSPLSGLVAAIGVKVGQQVKEGEHVLTLEAMKMNTFVFAPKDGKVKEISVEVGAAVNENQVLMVLE